MLNGRGLRVLSGRMDRLDPLLSIKVELRARLIAATKGRENRGNQQRIAEATQIPTSSLSTFKKDGDSLGPETLESLARYFGMEIQASLTPGASAGFDLIRQTRVTTSPARIIEKAGDVDGSPLKGTAVVRQLRARIVELESFVGSLRRLTVGAIERMDEVVPPSDGRSNTRTGSPGPSVTGGKHRP